MTTKTTREKTNLIDRKKEFDLLFADHLGTKHAEKKVWQWFKLQLEEEREEMRDEFYSSFQSILDDGWMSTERKIKKVMDDYVFTLKNSKEGKK